MEVMVKQDCLSKMTGGGGGGVERHRRPFGLGVASLLELL